MVTVHDVADFFVYERDKRVAIEANTPRALAFLRSYKRGIDGGKVILLDDGEAYEAFDAIDALGFSTMTY